MTTRKGTEMSTNQGHDIKTCQCDECEADRQEAGVREEIKNGTYFWGIPPEGRSAFGED
jgi:hypothetical protein